MSANPADPRPPLQWGRGVGVLVSFLGLVFVADGIAERALKGIDYLRASDWIVGTVLAIILAIALLVAAGFWKKVWFRTNLAKPLPPKIVRWYVGAVFAGFGLAFALMGLGVRGWPQVLNGGVLLGVGLFIAIRATLLLREAAPR